MNTGRYQAFLDGMRERGYVAGHHFTLEERFADGSTDALATAAQDLVRLRVELIVATGSQSVQAARRATADVPIVVTATSDPIHEGFAQSLARPGRNITGLYTSAAELIEKQIELLRLLLPKLSRLAMLSNPANTGHPLMLGAAREAGAKYGIAVHPHEARTQSEVSRAFAALGHERAQALLICADTFFLQQAQRISALAIQQRLPTLAWTREFAEAGGLMTYGQSVNENFRLAAGYVDQIFGGGKPSEMPFSRSSKVVLTVNRKTFRALGLSLPRSIESRVDEVIE